MRAFALLALGLSLSHPAMAQTIVTSARPERVGVTVYRDLDRGNQRPNLSWLNGYALISETRIISIPAGVSDLRFEGVASGIVPQSAIVTGLPDGIVERNRDALLLSAGSLVDRSLGQRVTLRRTNRVTGKTVEQEAVVRTGSDGGVVLQTAAGLEALRCSGLAETLVYPEVPQGLSARPTLSVRVRASQPVNATVTLSYLATGFDWQADYVATLSRDERTLGLQAWLTLASSDATSFADATAQAVAGRVNREAADTPPAEAPALRLSCWPQDRTHEVDEVDAEAQDDIYLQAPPPPPPPPPPPAPLAAQEIVVTGSRVTAQRERLGDLQLYRIPVPVTVASRAQKQVGLLDRPSVKVSPVYLFTLYAQDKTEDVAGRLVLRTLNREASGLGLPLPAGKVVLFREGAARPLLMGEGALDDHAVGEKVELRVSESPGVRARIDQLAKDSFHLVLTSDRPRPIAVEVELGHDEGARLSGDQSLVRRDGKLLWVTTVPANGRADLRYRIRS